MAAKVAMARRLARLESAYADQSMRMEREQLHARLVKLTQAERRERIVFLVNRQMQARGIRTAPGETLADAAARAVQSICPSVGHLAHIVKQIFVEAELSGRWASSGC
jgi:hypothetical protein